MGEVFRARDTRLDRTVAIKILPPLLGADPQLRFLMTRAATPRVPSQLRFVLDWTSQVRARLAAQ
jgi:hypothetical protein